MNYHDVMEMVKERALHVVPKRKEEPRDPQYEARKAAWQEMCSMTAWKDFMTLMEEVNAMPLEVLDEKSVTEVSLADAGFIKGVRSAVKTLKQKIQSRLT